MRVSANSMRLLRLLMVDLDEVLARPRKIPVHAPRQRQRRLTAPEVDALVAAYKAGADMKELAARYEVHRTTVANLLKLNHCQLRRQGITDVALPEVIRLYVADGWSCQLLAERFDCDDETVRQALKRAGVRLRKPWERG